MIEGRSDVLIVGAGPAGCAAGIVLARAGLDVCVVDRARFPRDKTCGDAVSSLAMAHARDLGAGEAIHAGPHAVVTAARAVFPDGTEVGRAYQPPGYIVPRLHLDQALHAALQGARATVHEGVAVRSLDQTTGGIAGARGDGFQWSCRAVIAADGPGSVAWSALQRPYPRGRHLAIATTVYLRGVTFPAGDHVADHYFEHELPCGYGWIFPAVEGLANVGVYQRSDEYERAEVPLRDLLAQFIDRHPDRFGAAEPEGRRRTWSLPIGRAPWSPGSPGLLLVGDAGGFIDPLSGEGIWQALHTGVLAGDSVARALAGGGSVDADAVAGYERAVEGSIGRHNRARERIQATMRFIVDRRLYRWWPVKAALSWGYGRGALEQSKTVAH